MAFIEATDGTSLFHTDAGTGKPVVLIHGWPLSSASWSYQAPALLEHGYRVISYDRRGFGQSGQPETGYEYDTFAADLNAVLTSLNVTGATLVGFSMGGGEVARYLATYGSFRVERAVFVSAVTPYMLKTEDNPEGVDHKVFDGMVAGIEKDRAGFMKSFAHSFYGDGMLHHTVKDGVIDEFMSMAMQASPKATLDCVRAFSTTDFRNDLLTITVPTMIVHGTADATVPIDVSGRRTRKMVASSELMEYDGQAHGLNVTAAEKLNADLIAFLGHPLKVAAY